jgi:hypothetical protein
MRSVLSVTHPGERVFDCWTGLYLTRKPAFPYFFLLSDVIRVLEPERFEADLLGALRNPEVTAAIIDRNFEILPASVRAYVRRAFVAEADVPGLRVRRRSADQVLLPSARRTTRRTSSLLNGFGT